MSLRTHNLEGLIVLYHMHTTGHESTIVEEGRKSFEKARDLEASDTIEEFKWKSQEIPDFLLVLKVPNIHGQTTKKLDKIPWQMKNQQKALHITSDAKHAKQIQNLIQVKKDRNLVEPIWGKQVCPNNVIVTKKDEKDRTKSWQISNVKKYTKRHMNYHLRPL
jgi:hypothetical protein